MSDSLVLRDNWMTRLLRAVGLVTPVEESDFKAGADYASHYTASKSYPASTSMSAYAAFPWVYACADAIASDLSMLPIKAQTGSGADAETIENHPMLELMADPSSRVDAVLFRRQLLVDLVLTGDAYALLIGAPPNALLRMHPARTKIVPMPDGQPGKYEYDGQGSSQVYDWTSVMHVRSPSWEDSPASLYGQGTIRALNEDLQTDLAASKLASSSAKTGRPSAIISPAEDGDRWSNEQIRILREAYERQLAGTSGALFLGGPAKFEALSFSPRDMEYGQVRHLAREAVLAAFSVPPVRVGLPTANYATSRQQARVYWESLRGRAAAVDAELTRIARTFPGSESVTISHDFSDVEALQESRSERQNRVQMWYLMGVPLSDAAAYEGFDDLPVGLEDTTSATATTGEQTPETAKESAATAIGFLFRDSPTQVPSAFPFPPEQALALKTESPRVWAAGVNDKIGSALLQMWQRDGALIARNEAEEALLASRENLLKSTARGTSLEAVVSQAQLFGTVSHGLEYMTELLKYASSVSEGALTVNGEAHTAELTVTREEADGVYWRVWLRRLHTPIERAFTMSVRRYSAGAAKRIADRYGEMYAGKQAAFDAGVKQKALTDVEIEKLMSWLEEAALMNDALKPIYEEAVRRGYEDAASRVGVTDEGSVVQSTLVRQSVETLLGRWEETTQKFVLDIIQQGVDEGLTVTEIQKSLIESRAYDPVRALRVARTETTRTLNAAASAAYNQAALNGTPLKRKWVSARDDHVRDSHRVLDGTIINPGERYFSINGGSAEFPGGFGSGSEDINCRCVEQEIFE